MNFTFKRILSSLTYDEFYLTFRFLEPKQDVTICYNRTSKKGVTHQDVPSDVIEQIINAAHLLFEKDDMSELAYHNRLEELETKQKQAPDELDFDDVESLFELTKDQIQREVNLIHWYQSLDKGNFQKEKNEVEHAEITNLFHFKCDGTDLIRTQFLFQGIPYLLYTKVIEDSLHIVEIVHNQVCDYCREMNQGFSTCFYLSPFKHVLAKKIFSHPSLRLKLRMDSRFQTIDLMSL